MQKWDDFFCLKSLIELFLNGLNYMKYSLLRIKGFRHFEKKGKKKITSTDQGCKKL